MLRGKVTTESGDPTPPISQSFQESEENEVILRNYLLAILNRRWMILTLTVLAVAATTIYGFLQTPVYRSKAVVSLQIPVYVMLPDSGTPVLKNDSSLNTQVKLLEGRTLARKVAEKLDLTREKLQNPSAVIKKQKDLTPEQKEARISETASLLLKMVKITPLPSTNLCEIIFTTPSPLLSKNLANSWAEEYLRTRLDSMQSYTRTAEELLMEQVQALQQEVLEKEKQLHDYSAEKAIIKLENDQSLSSFKMNDIQSALAGASRERIDAEVRYHALRSTSAQAIPELFADGAASQARQKYADLERQYLDKSKIYKPDYPEMVRLREAIEHARSAIDAATSRAHQSVLAQARMQYEEAVSKERTLQAQLRGAMQDSVQSSREELGYNQLRMEIENKKQLLALLLQKQNSTDVTAQSQGKVNFTTGIVEYAELPKKVDSPNIKQSVLFSLFTGLIGSMFLALLLDYFDRSLKSPDDVERYLHLPFLGLVPHYFPHNGDGVKRKRNALLPTKNRNGNEREVYLERYNPYRLSVLDDACSASEAIKTLRTSLLLAFPVTPPKSLLITSSRAGEGKTFISCNLAIALTQLDKRVVLVDADLRNPRLHRVWNLQNDIGVSIYLTSETAVDSVIRPSPLEKLHVITSGPKTPRPAELLASDRFKEMLSELQKRFDFVIVDSPPVLPVADPVIVASSVEGVLLVVRGGSTPRDIVKMAKKKLSVSNAIMAGVVLNGIDLADLYYYYRYYSGYYSEYYGPSEKASNL